MAELQALNNPYNFNGEFYNKMKEFWEKYGPSYPKFYQNMLQSQLLVACTKEIIPDLFMEVYSHCNVATDFAEDPYKYYLEFLTNNFQNFENQQILEVAAGAYPVLTEKISKYITKTKGCGSITGIDPNLITTKVKNANLYKEKLQDISLTNYNLIIGQSPCEATEEIILRSCIEKKEMSILLCGCTHMGFSCSYDTWIDYLCYMINQHKSQDFKFEEHYLPESSGVDYPILTLKQM